jgi:hypothetical protein
LEHKITDLTTHKHDKLRKPRRIIRDSRFEIRDSISEIRNSRFEIQYLK